MRDLATRRDELQRDSVAGLQAAKRLQVEVEGAGRDQAAAHQVVETAVTRLEQLETTHREATVRTEAALQALMAQHEDGATRTEAEVARARAADDTAVEVLHSSWQDRLRTSREQQLIEIAAARRQLEGELQSLRDTHGPAQAQLENERDQRLTEAQSTLGEHLEQAERGQVSRRASGRSGSQSREHRSD